MNFDQLSVRVEKYAAKVREEARAGFVKFRDLLTINVLEGMIIPKKCLCVAIEKGAVSIAYGTRFLSKPAIKGLKRFAFDGGKYPTPDEMTLALNEAADIFGARGASIVLSVPRPWFIVRTAEMPLVVKDNLTSVIAYELDRLTPLGPAEAMYDFSVISEENERIKLLIVAMRAQTLQPYMDALEINHLSAQRVTTSITGFGTVCRVLGTGGETTVCLDIRNDGYDGCTIKEGVLHSTVSENFLENEGDNLELIKEGLAPMLRELETGEIPPVVLVSSAPRYENIQNEIGLPVRPVTKDDLKAKFGAEIDDELTGPLGGLVEEIWPGQKGFNLAGKGFQAEKKNPVTRITMVLLGIIVLAMALNLIVPLYMEKTRVDRIEGQIASRRNEVKAIEALRQEASTIDADITSVRNFKESAPMSLDIMKELTTILQKNVWLTRLRITGETVEIEGYASSATEILPKLEQSGQFRKVEFSSPTIRDMRLNADRFVIKMEIEGFDKKMGAKPISEKK
ncbi:MAG: PilN domain-containing protein [Syntrophorhabdaceae bacterium]|nr:PilN domain-containing protein [Syntrophorhabdaceae bacterium]MDD4196245.1 PilN domain-containing protein [Syntrophorhabdaceae bacterium]